MNGSHVVNEYVQILLNQLAVTITISLQHLESIHYGVRRGIAHTCPTTYYKLFVEQ